MKRVLASAALVSAALILLAGCTAGGGGASSPSQNGPAAPVGPGTPQNDGGAEPAPLGEGKAADGSASQNGVAAGQQVVTTGWISITVDDPIATSGDAVALVERNGGRIDNRSEQAATDSQRASAQLTIQVPSDGIDETLDALKELGHVDSVSIGETDVTLQVSDLDARIAALQASVDRLKGLLSSAASVSDLVELETALSTRQADLDGLKSQRDSIADQVDYSTVQLNLVSKGALPSGVPGDFWSGLGVGWAALLAAGAGFTVALGIALPWLGVLAVIAVIVGVIVRLATRGARGKTPTA